MATGEWGGLTEVSKGKWRIRYSADIGDGRGYMRHTETFRGGVRAAKRRLAELRTLYDTGAARTRVPTFDELWERDVLPGVLKLAPNTRRTYLCTWKLVSERWGGVRLDAYNGADVQDWLGGLPRRMGKSCLTLMRKVSNRAVLLGVVRFDPLAAEIKASDFSKRPPERTETDLGPYFAAVMEGGGPMMLAAVLLMAAGGCRFGEALAVKARSVRWDEEGRRALFDVEDQVHGDEPRLTGRLKNEQSRRTASVPGQAGRLLCDVAERAIREGCTFVCDDGTGRPVSEAAFRQRFKRIVSDAGLEHVTLRSLRRSYATAMLDAGADAGAVNLSMGHTRDSRVLFTNYDRPNTKSAPKLPDAWRQSLKTSREWDILGQSQQNTR